MPHTDGELAHTELPEGEIMQFRHLSPEEAERFREYAKKNDPPAIEDWLIYHPVCREVWDARGIDPNNYPAYRKARGMPTLDEIHGDDHDD